MNFVGFLLWFLYAWLVIVCVWMFVWILIDIFRDHTLNGWAKAGWVILMVVLPFVGALIYLIARGRSMTARQANLVTEQEQAQRGYIRGVVDPKSPAEEIARAQELLSSGVITQGEFESLKSRAIG